MGSYLADEQVVLPGWMMVYGLWRRDEEPDDVDDDLNDDDDGADGQLRPGRNEPGTLGAPLGRVEDPRDAVGLGQQSAVHDGEAQADAEFLHSAHTCSRPHLQNTNQDYIRFLSNLDSYVYVK